MTTRGMGTQEMIEIGALIHRTFTGIKDEAKLVSIRQEVERLAAKFPLYKDWN